MQHLIMAWFLASACALPVFGQRSPRVVDTVPAMLSLPASTAQPDAFVGGVGGGHFKWVAASTATTNATDVFARTYGEGVGRWVRQPAIGGTIELGSGGLTIDGGTNDYSISIQDMANTSIEGVNASITGLNYLVVDGQQSLELFARTNLYLWTPSVWAQTATAGQVLTLSDPLTGQTDFATPAASNSDPFSGSVSTLPLYVFGDSQSFGVNAVATNYTSGGNLLPQLRPFALVATNGSRAMPLTNYAIGGARISYVPDSASFPDRANPFNRIGRWLPVTWSGVATVMIGYNNFLYVNSGFDDIYRRATEAQIARLFLTGYVADGVTHAGVSYDSWSTTGSTVNGAYADLNPFPRGNPGSDVTRWTVIDGGETISLTLTNQARAAVFWDTTAIGGLFDIYTNGAIALRVNGGFAYTGASTNENFPQVLTFAANATGTFSITITNVTGTNYIGAIGFLPATIPSDRRVILGNITPRIKDGETSPFDVERRMGYQVQLAALRWRVWPVWVADVFNRMDTTTHYQVGDESHTTPAGAAAIAEAFNQPAAASQITEPLQSALGIVGEALVSGGAVSFVNGGSTTRNQWRRNGLNRWSLESSSATESGSDAGSLLELYSHTDAGAQKRLMMRGYRDQDIIQWPTLMELGDRSDSSTLVRVTGASGSTRDIGFVTGSSPRWLLRVTGAESGSNAGADFQLLGRDDSGNPLWTALSIARATGLMTFGNSVAFSSPAQFNSTIIMGSGTGSGLATVRGEQNNTKDLVLQTGSTNRWVIRANSATESGGNAGSDFQILNRDDAGNAMGTPLQITRSSGLVSLGNGLDVTGTTVLRGATTIGTAGASLLASLRGGQNQVRDLAFQTDSTNRWIIRVAANTETGSSNAGSDFQILRRADNGTALDEPFIISRSTGNLTLGATGTSLRRIRHGTAVLSGGAATVSDANVTASSRIILTSQSDGGTPGWLRVSARSAGVSFTITSSSGTDTSTVAWVLIEP